MTDRERDQAIKEAHNIAASEAYFAARVGFGYPQPHAVFDAGFSRGWDASRAPLLERIAELEAENTRLEELVYSPGLWRCAKCKFILVQRNLNAHSGTVTARDQPGDKCPNCDVNLWRVTERENALENYEAAESLQIRLNELEAKLAQQEPETTIPIAWYDEVMDKAYTLTDLDGGDPGEFIPLYSETLSAAPAAPEQKEPIYTAADVTDAHAKGYRLGMAQAPNAQQAEAQEPDDASLLKALNAIKPMDRTKPFEMAAPLTQEEIAEAESDRAIPKAWANFTPDGNIRIWSKKPESVEWSGLELVPLFTRPQPAQLQRLSEEETMTAWRGVDDAGDDRRNAMLYGDAIQSAIAAKNGAALK